MIFLFYSVIVLGIVGIISYLIKLVYLLLTWIIKVFYYYPLKYSFRGIAWLIAGREYESELQTKFRYVLMGSFGIVVAAIAAYAAIVDYFGLSDSITAVVRSEAPETSTIAQNLQEPKNEHPRAGQDVHSLPFEAVFATSTEVEMIRVSDGAGPEATIIGSYSTNQPAFIVLDCGPFLGDL